MKNKIMLYCLGMLLFPVLGLSGCAELTKTGGNYAYVDPHNIDNTNTPPRPTASSFAEFDSLEYQQRLRQWEALTDKK